MPILRWLQRELGKVVQLFHSAWIVYNGYKNSHAVNNGGGTISGNCGLGFPENIFIGQNTYINGGSINASKNAKIIIGENCLISYCVHMRTDMHCYEDASTLIRNQGHIEKDIIIGNDVWIGYGAQIMAGVVLLLQVQ